jgi:hypothetical protein
MQLAILELPSRSQAIWGSSPASSNRFRFPQIASSWRLPIRKMIGLMSRVNRLGWTSHDQRISVPAGMRLEREPTFNIDPGHAGFRTQPEWSLK